MNPGRTEVLGEHATNPPTPAIGGITIETGWCQRCAKPTSLAMTNGDCPACGSAMTIRSWPVSGLEDRITAQFEKEVRRRARMAYIDLQQTDVAESQQLRSLYMDEFTAGAYNWDDQGANPNNHVLSARMKTWGALYLLYLLLKRCDQSMTEERARDIWLANIDDSMAVYLWALGLSGNSKLPSKTALTGGGKQQEAVTKTMTTTNGTQTPPPVMATIG